jgi:hypothetical protein
LARPRILPGFQHLPPIVMLPHPREGRHMMCMAGVRVLLKVRGCRSSLFAVQHYRRGEQGLELTGDWLEALPVESVDVLGAGNLQRVMWCWLELLKAL